MEAYSGVEVLLNFRNCIDIERGALVYCKKMHQLQEIVVILMVEWR
jgi:hypothetical protein